MTRITQRKIYGSSCPPRKLRRISSVLDLLLLSRPEQFSKVFLCTLPDISGVTVQPVFGGHYLGHPVPMPIPSLLALFTTKPLPVTLCLKVCFAVFASHLVCLRLGRWAHFPIFKPYPIG